MIFLIPMGGHGTRFQDKGYKLNKACIPTTDRHTGNKLPMVVCAMNDMPGIKDPKNKIICVNRDFHEQDGTENTIREHFSQVIFIHDKILLDQGYACYLAKDYLGSDEELFIGACDNGIEINLESFERAKQQSDALMISHANDQNIEHNPEAHSWALLQDENSKTLAEISLKKTVSNNPMKDHATTGMFWFKHSKVFLQYLEKMIQKKDTLSGKYYVDKVLQYLIDDGLCVQYFDVKYICWGTPKDYEDYENTLNYWEEFYRSETWIKNQK